MQDEIDKLVLDIENTQSLYQRGGQRYAGPDYVSVLHQRYFQLYLHANLNFTIHEVFNRYQNLTAKTFHGFVTSYQTPGDGLTAFHDFILTEAILHVNADELKKILRDVDQLKMLPGCVDNLLSKLINLLTSMFETGIFNDPYENTLLAEHLSYTRFRYTYYGIFARTFLMLTYLEISKEQFDKCRKPLLHFLKTEREMAHFELKELTDFIQKKGDLFEPEDLMEILKLAIEGHHPGFVKYHSFVETVPRALHHFYPEYKIENKHLIKKALLNSCSDERNEPNYKSLVYLVKACNEECKGILYAQFEALLDKSFNGDFYQDLLYYADFDDKRKNYFEQYSLYINKHKGGRAIKVGPHTGTDMYFVNYAQIIYYNDIALDRSELQLLTGLNKFECWVLNPYNFNYNEFDAKWLIDIPKSIIIKKLAGNDKISIALEEELKRCFQPVLAEIRYKYFVEL